MSYINVSTLLDGMKKDPSIVSANLDDCEELVNLLNNLGDFEIVQVHVMELKGLIAMIKYLSEKQNDY